MSLLILLGIAALNLVDIGFNPWAALRVTSNLASSFSNLNWFNTVNSVSLLPVSLYDSSANAILPPCVCRCEALTFI